MDEIEQQPVSDARRKRKPRVGFVLPWPVLTLALLVIALASLAALVIVVTLTNADTLATVALVLAILAFGTQLIVTGAQTMSANEQYRQVNRLYEDTRAVLKRIRVQSKMLLSNQSDQFNKILDHVLSPGAIESAVAEARGESDPAEVQSGDAPASATDVNEISKLLRAEAERVLAEDRADRVVVRTRRTVPDPDELRRFPREDEARETAGLFQALSDEAKGYIRNIADRFNKSTAQRIRTAQLNSGPVSALPRYVRELEKSGFVSLEPFRVGGTNKTGIRLTPQGIVAVRFLTGQGVIPSYLRDVIGEDDST